MHTSEKIACWKKDVQIFLLSLKPDDVAQLGFFNWHIHVTDSGLDWMEMWELFNAV